MRKNTIALALALALSAGVASAQSTQPSSPNRDRGAWQKDGGERGMRGGRRGPEGMLLKGITLSDAQKAQLQSLRKDEQAKREGSRDQFRSAMDDARAARQRGDTAAARARMQALRSQMDQQREREFSAIRNILTADQRAQFDANVAAMKQRQAERGDRGERWGRGGERGGHRHEQGDSARAGKNG